MYINWFDGGPFLVWSLAHIAGLIVAFLTQLSLNPRMEALLRTSLAMGIVGVAAIALSTEIASSIGWVASGATLGAMVIAAVWEPTRTAHDPLLARLITSHDTL
jgi:hypothetical protein